ncbi:acetylxylan esterase [Paenibacillus filicis]|uniref:Acetylxylan esterase n=1 Tax=Paenibacillus gyeongsangnamensis TaxID=3388067 RepID=A0ABT4Q3Z3_9BACL|nr:acetylxylan esterase [Paenibacillus filicis]MCZ8511507.1 acetylxylan esterase [Paenibacillus filicis]
MVQPYDMPLDELRIYRPLLTRQADFAEFWIMTKAYMDQEPYEIEIRPVYYPVEGVRVYDLSYRGYNGARIRCWYAVPDRPGPHPGIVMHHKYNFYDFTGDIHDVVNMALHGYCVLGMYVRAQVRSEDNSISPSGHAQGWMSQGILHKETYYYRGVYMDAVRAVEILAGRKEVDASRIGVVGGSQGAALGLVSAALTNIPKVVVAEYPYLSDFPRAINMAQTGYYLELNEYLRHDPYAEEPSMNTLTYYDVMNFAPWVKCPVLMSIGLIDTITPPSTVFAVYNHLQTEKEICVYRFFGHEYIPDFVTKELQFLRQNLLL